MSLIEIKLTSITEIATKLGIVIKRKKAECYNGHDTKTPSLSFNEKKGVFYCFGCGEGGDQIELVQKVLKFNFKQSCSWIEQEFNLNPSIYPKSKFYRKKQRPSIRKKTNSISPYRASPEIYEWLMGKLDLSQKGKDYLISSRGFSEEIIESIGIKDITNVEKKISELTRKWGLDKLLECGLFKINTATNITKFVWWDHTIIFPFKNLNYRISYLQGRRMNTNVPKYVNLKGVEPDLFNLESLNYIKQGDNLFICEGVTDSISALMKGLNVVGVLGANGFKEKWSRMLLNYEIIVVPDSDRGGKVFANSIRKHFKQLGKPIRIANLPKGKDLNDLLNESK